MLKTTVALTLAANTPFAGRFSVKRSGAVVYFAAEGFGAINSRLTAVLRHMDMRGAQPFAYRSDCPPLVGMGTAAKMVVLIREAAAELKQRFGVDVALIVVDTVAAAAGYIRSGDKSDAAVGAKIIATLGVVQRAIGAPAVAVDHFGKDASVGTRGGSAKESGADFVLAALGDRELAGAITNTRLAIRKERDGEPGLELPFAPRLVDVGVDEDGDPIRRPIIDWGGQVPPPAKAEKGWPRSEAVQLLRRTLMAMLSDHGQDIRPFANNLFADNNLLVRACRYDIVKAEFEKRYPASGDSDPTKRAEAKYTAFRRAVGTGITRGLIATRDIGGVEWIWFNAAESPLS